MKTVVACLSGAILAVLSVAAPAQVLPPEPQTLFQELPGYPPEPSDLGRTASGRPCEVSTLITVADVDGDGDGDVITCPLLNKQPRLYLNDGHGHLNNVSATHMPAITGSVWQIATGDIDGDGDLDIVFPLRNDPTYLAFYVLVNDGSGRFQDQSRLRLPSAQAFPFTRNDAAVLGDFDRDGDLDLVSSGRHLAPYPYSCRMLENDGAGHFSAAPLAFPQDGGMRSTIYGILRVHDIDRDGDLDLVGNAWSGAAACWINDGRGRFTEESSSRMPTSAFGSGFSDIRLGDVDGDDDLDFVGTRSFNHPVLYLNDGIGYFQDVTSTHVPTTPDAKGFRVVIGDIDDDGDLDFVTSDPSHPPTTTRRAIPGEEQVYVNDGIGHFRLDTDWKILPRVPNGHSYDCELADLDGDGDLDALMSDFGVGWFPVCRMRYYSNTTRHLYADRSPERGKTWNLIVHGPPGAAALLALGPRTASTPIPPLGTLALDSQSLVVWAHGVRTDGERRATLRIPIPALPALGGAPLYAQALLVETSGLARFTNLWISEPIR
jgi:hypothetical protein